MAPWGLTSGRRYSSSIAHKPAHRLRVLGLCCHREPPAPDGTADSPSFSSCPPLCRGRCSIYRAGSAVSTPCLLGGRRSVSHRDPASCRRRTAHRLDMRHRLGREAVEEFRRPRVSKIERRERQTRLSPSLQSRMSWLPKYWCKFEEVIQDSS